MKKEKTKISTVLLSMFFIMFILLSVAIYYLPNYYFLDANVEFNPNDSRASVNIVKARKLKLPDFSMFDSGKFKVLQRGYWDVFNEDNLKRGNSNPFDRIAIVEAGGVDDNIK